MQLVPRRRSRSGITLRGNLRCRPCTVCAAKNAIFSGPNSAKFADSTRTRSCNECVSHTSSVRPNFRGQQYSALPLSKHAECANSAARAAHTSIWARAAHANIWARAVTLVRSFVRNLHATRVIDRTRSANRSRAQASSCATGLAAALLVTCVASFFCTVDFSCDPARSGNSKQVRHRRC